MKQGIQQHPTVSMFKANKERASCPAFPVFRGAGWFCFCVCGEVGVWGRWTQNAPASSACGARRAVLGRKRLLLTPAAVCASWPAGYQTAIAPIPTQTPLPKTAAYRPTTERQGLCQKHKPCRYRSQPGVFRSLRGATRDPVSGLCKPLKRLDPNFSALRA